MASEIALGFPNSVINQSYFVILHGEGFAFSYRAMFILNQGHKKYINSSTVKCALYNYFSVENQQNLYFSRVPKLLHLTVH